MRYYVQYRLRASSQPQDEVKGILVFNLEVSQGHGVHGLWDVRLDQPLLINLKKKVNVERIILI